MFVFVDCGFTVKTDISIEDSRWMAIGRISIKSGKIYEVKSQKSLYLCFLLGQIGVFADSGPWALCLTTWFKHKMIKWPIKQKNAPHHYTTSLNHWYNQDVSMVSCCLCQILNLLYKCRIWNPQLKNFFPKLPSSSFGVNCNASYLSSSAYLGCNQWLSDLLLPSYQLETVQLFSSDLWPRELPLTG